MAHNIHFVGNLGADPELRYLDNGKAVCNVSIADNRSWTDKEGVKKKETTWFRCTFWEAQAETINQYFKKGDGIYIRQARLKVDEETGGPRIWKTDEGEARATYELVVQQWEFAGKSSGSGRNEGGPPVEEEDEIPF